MSYLIETVKAGRVIEIRKKYSARYGLKGIPRAENTNPTPEDAEKVNQVNAERKLRWILNANFKGGDYHIVFGWKKDQNPSPKDAIVEYERFLRRARNVYKKENIPFHYVAAMERGENGRRKIHFHMIVNFIDPRKLSAVWPFGRIKFFPLDDSGQYAELASYIIKRTSKTFRSGEGFKKRYNSSSNLIIPTPKNKVVSRNKWILEPKPIKGYYIEKDKTYNGISEQTGYPVQFYSMVKLPERKTSRKKE